MKPAMLALRATPQEEEYFELNREAPGSLRGKNIKKMYFVYPRSTKEFSRTRSEMPVHSRIELEFGNFGF